MSKKEFITLLEAPKYLGISYWKLLQLIKESKLAYQVDVLDNRRKLIKITDLDNLKARSLQP